MGIVKPESHNITDLQTQEENRQEVREDIINSNAYEAKQIPLLLDYCRQRAADNGAAVL